MQFYRLVKPVWAQRELANGDANPKFIADIPGDNVIEGCDFTFEYLQQQNALGYNVYFFPNHPSSDVYVAGIKHLNGRAIDVFNYVFVDMDLKDGIYASKDDFLNKLSEFKLKPSMVVDSGNGVHAYWKMSNLTRDAYVLMQMALLKYFRTDESVWTVLQLMRLPGFMNTKRHNDYVPANLLVDLSSNAVYMIEDFPKEIFDTLTTELQTKARNHINRLEGKLDIELGSEVNVDELPDKFIALMQENSEIAKLFHDPKSHGDRSSADMRLANLLFNRKFNVLEALAVISNTQKALEKGAHRNEYAALTVSKVYQDRPNNKIKSVSQYLADEESRVHTPQVFGPHYMDYEVLGEPWRKQEILGLIAGAGVGKTAVGLNIVQDLIRNNPGNDDVYVFFSLEMPKGQIIKRWVKAVGADSVLANRLYVVDNQDEKGMPVNIGLQEIYEYCQELRQVTGKDIGAILIDHFHIISSHIDTRKRPNFGIASEQGTGWGDIRNLSSNTLATQLKSLIKSLNTFGIVLSQTTKEKGVGDLAIGKDGSYGTSQYEWIMDRIVTIWQPLMRVQHMTPFRFLAFQYAKIREKHPKDKIRELEPKLLTYDLESGNLRVTNQDEYRKFMELLPLANEARDAAMKKKSNSYSIQVDLSSLDDLVDKLKVAK